MERRRRPVVGRHYQLAETICSPRPIAQPHPPILVGGDGEKKTLRLVARYVDACNLNASTPDRIAGKLDVLREHCDRQGRDYDAIRKTIVVFVDPFSRLDDFLDECDRYADFGIDEVILMADNDPVAFTERIVELIVPRLGPA